MIKKVIIAGAMLAAISSCKMENPFLTESKAPYGAPEFDKIKTEHYMPAFEVAIAEAKAEIDRLTSLGYGDLPVCMAKTQYSFSDDATKLGAPCGFTVTVRKVKVSAGAGFIVALTGNIMTMPGLPKVPAAERIDVDENGKISGLF